MIRTSETHPLRIFDLTVPGRPGRIGLTFCPGKQQPEAMTGAWARDLRTDLRVIRDWGANLLLTLVEDHELRSLRVPDLGERARALGIDWLHLPIADMRAPDAEFETSWAKEGPDILNTLSEGGHVVIHCKGGLGRTGTIAAREASRCRSW